jgi:prevent-host-death family protein
MLVTATDFKENLGKYLNTVTKDDVYITKNGKIVARLSKTTQDKQAILDSLLGIAEENPVSLEEAKAARLARQ